MRAKSLAIIIVQLLVLAVAFGELDILPMAFRRVVYLALAGFIFHHFLPVRFRLPFFVTLSISSIYLALGTPSSPEHFWDPAGIPRASMVVGLGVLLIGICRLPLGFWLRAGLLAVAGAIAAVFRIGLLKSGGLEVIWIILSAMFMFRIIIYLYDIATMPQRPSWMQSLAYFFLFPNIGYTLFPVIDFKTFCRSHYNAADVVIYQRGIGWIVRGIVQLIIYRYVNEVFAIPFSRVATGADIIRFLVTNSLIYLNVSGSFHLVTGLLLLFGFNLPESNHSYFLASSFTDYWRRVNIYWKDFMIKVFYYPLFFRLKKHGTTQALVLATLWAFFITWALHLYQTWWLKGTATVSVTDSLFWLVLGILVLVNSLWEAKRVRARISATRQISVSEIAVLLLSTAGTFAAISLLWSLWCSPSLSDWLAMWRHANRSTFVDGMAVLAIVMAAKFAMDVWPSLRKRPASPDLAAAGVSSLVPLRRICLGIAPVFALIVLAQPAIQARLPNLHLERFGPRLRADRLYDVLEGGDSFLNQKEEDEFNYYKALTTLDEVNRQRMQIMMGRSVPLIPHDGNPPLERVPDFRLEILRPNAQALAYETDDFKTNRWGMRDRDYELIKAPGTLRIALLGSSHSMGYAVHQDQSFETILEEKLNRELPPGLNVKRIEILNFAQPGWAPLSQIAELQQQVSPFKPDVVILVSHQADLAHNNVRLRKAVHRGYPITDSFLTDMMHKARVDVYVKDGLMEKRLKPYEYALAAWSFQQLSDECRALNAAPVYVFLPAVGSEVPMSPKQREDAAALNDMASKAGFDLIDLSHVFDHEVPDQLKVGIIPHSNARAHRIIAETLYQQLTTGPGLAVLQRAQKPASSAAAFAPQSSSH